MAMRETNGATGTRCSGHEMQRARDAAGRKKNCERGKKIPKVTTRDVTPHIPIKAQGSGVEPAQGVAQLCDPVMGFNLGGVQRAAEAQGLDEILGHGLPVNLRATRGTHTHGLIFFLPHRKQEKMAKPAYLWVRHSMRVEVPHSTVHLSRNRHCHSSRIVRGKANAARQKTKEKNIRCVVAQG
jgi:hypothetical protein